LPPTHRPPPGPNLAAQTHALLQLALKVSQGSALQPRPPSSGSLS
jgi:hypothetical protein